MYEDLLVVKAATEGAVLIIEGIEKCERNVLPILNNLLENREMALEDGRFLINYKKFDSIDEESFERLKLVKVHPDFRVIALGLPVPLYPGNPMDPPLRSRFQCRNVTSPNIESHLITLSKIIAPSGDNDAINMQLIEQLITLTDILQSITIGQNGREGESNQEIQSNIPYFPDTPGLVRIVNIINKLPLTDIERLIHRVYPYKLICSESEQTVIDMAIQKFMARLPNMYSNKINYEINNIQRVSKNKCEVAFIENGSGKITKELINCGGGELQVDHLLNRSRINEETSNKFIYLKKHKKIMTEMIVDHMAGVDICIISEKGNGKSSIIKEFSKILGNGTIKTMYLYEDMSARDLLQIRRTNERGDTYWEDTILIKALLNGDFIILDGIDKLNPSTFSVLQRLLIDRECTLFDGTEIIRSDRFKLIKNNLPEDILSQKNIKKSNKNFRVIALAEPMSNQLFWLNSEVISLFHFHHLEKLDKSEKIELFTKLFPNISINKITSPLLDIEEFISNYSAMINTPTSDSAAPREENQRKKINSILSLRQIKRFLNKINNFYSEDDEKQIQLLFEKVQGNRVDEKEIEEIMNYLIHRNLNYFSSSLQIQKSEKLEIKFTHKDGRKILSIGEVECPVNLPSHFPLVPKVNFFDLPNHVTILQQLLKDFILNGTISWLPQRPFPLVH